MLIGISFKVRTMRLGEFWCNIDNKQLKQTREVVTEPLTRVLTTISPFMSDIIKPNLHAQSTAMKK